MELGVTKVVQDRLKTTKIEESKGASLVFCWDTHLTKIKGRNVLFIVNASNRYTIAMTDIEPRNWNYYIMYICSVIHGVMQEMGYSEEQIGQYFKMSGDTTVTKTHGRKSVGGINRMVMDAQYFGKKLEKEAKYQWELSEYLNRDICQPEGFDAYGYPSELFKLDMERLGIISKRKPAKIIAACGHDTQSAMVAVPASEKDFAFLSCGTWSLLGTELDAPVINEKSAKLNVSNETGYGAKTSFLKNIIGLWLIQESRRQWIREGRQYSFAELEDMARKAEPFRCFIDVDAPEFTPAGNIPERIKEYCKKTGQYVPENDSEVMRCIYESLAMKYRTAVNELEDCTNKKFSKLYMVGGGTKDKFLSELTADSLGIEVSSGPVEATSYGNIAIQLIADGEIRDIETARKIIAASEKLCTFAPENTAEWNKYYKIYLEKVK